MKKKVVAAIMVSVFILAGCQSKDIFKRNAAATSSKEATLKQANSKTDKVQVDLRPLEPNTLPQLNKTQKAQVNTKFNSALNDIKSSLNALDNVEDIDLELIN